MNPLPVSLPFTDRSEAGRRLAERVRAYAVTDPIVLALPRGGVPVGAELARHLRIPLDVLLVRKIGMPGHQETGVGAITEDGHACFDDRALARIRMPREMLSSTVEAERAELARRLEVYRGSRAAPRLTGRDVIVVDDGVATGGTARAALQMVRRQRPARLVLAVPVGSQQAVEILRPEVEDLVVLTVPENFRAVGEWYRDFAQLSDGDVTAILAELRTPADEAGSERAVRIRAGDVYLEGELATPAEVRAGVVFALSHGRHDPRQRAVAANLRRSGYATLLFDLLTHDEWRRESDEDANGVDTAVLDERLQAAVRWLRRATDLASAPVGLFGSGAAAPAALMTAAARPEDIAALVVHGGRIDIAEESLPKVRAPVLVLVEGTDSFVRELAEWVLGRLSAPYDMRVMPGAEQLLARSEVWHEVGTAAADWFERYL
ncbi:phosphoribosyltransferase family protein [Allosalinactinospora lopnorensis]|uniref:phosphoribosyltransferase family protein n=1 Tax=Allosalinactinospora lopnorensis TaxID=1352348 RepID=UPI000623FFE7|nr:phosphoribosyltransferase family protein [Allosalinactinospora lopnorensis]